MDKLTLEIVSRQEIEELLSLWDDGSINQDRLKTYLQKKTFFATWLKNNHEPRPIKSTLSIIRNGRGFGLFESPYLDLEFWDSYSGFYGTCFTPKDRNCSRIHFFTFTEGIPRKGQSTDDIATEVKCLLEGGGDENDVLALGLEYAGYCVFRPITSNVVGRTAVQFEDTASWELSDGSTIHPKNIHGKPFLTAKQKCSATIFNARFSLDTAEFIQQDPQLGQCASASLWVASSIASKKFGTRHVKFPNITKNAVGGKLPSIPVGYAPVEANSGLSTAEIRNALSATGTSYQSYAPKLKFEDSTAVALRLGNFIYSYVESGLPVILSMHGQDAPLGHAVSAVGHFLPAEISEKKFIPLSRATGVPIHERHFLVSSAVDLYYVHDDCTGPFNKLELVMHAEDPPVATKPCFCERRGFIEKSPEPPREKPRLRAKLDGRKEIFTITEVIVPVHFRIRNNSWDSIHLVIDRWHKYFSVSYPEDTILVWRSFLTSGAEFKRSLRHRGYTSGVRAFYASLQLPKYTWVHEFTETKPGKIGGCFQRGASRTIDGEFLVDATTARTDINILCGRVGQVYWTDPREKQIDREIKEFACFEQRYLELPGKDGTNVEQPPQQ